MKTALLPLVISGFFIGTAVAQSIADQVESLKALKVDSVAKANASGSSNTIVSDQSEFRGEDQDFSNNLSTFQSYLQGGNYEQALQILQRWKARTKNEQVKKSLATLIDSIQKEQQKRIDEITKRLSDLNAQTAATVVKMTSPDEVDAIQQKYEDFRSVEFPNGGTWTNGLYNRINRVTSFLQYWRQFLAAEDENNYSQAINALVNLRNNGTAGLITSKDISARYAALLQKQLASNNSNSSPLGQAVATLMADLKTSEQIPAINNKLNSLTYNLPLGGDDRMISGLKTELNALARMQNDFSTGAFARVINATDSNAGPTPYDEQLNALSIGLKIRAISAMHKLPDLGTPKPGEGLASFIHAAAEKACEKKDWPRLYVLLTVYGNVSGGGCSYTGNMQEGVRAFLAGQQLQQAGQIPKAIDQYTICITQLGPLVPRDEAKQAIDQLQTRLQATHP